MKYLIRSSKGQVSPCEDDTAVARIKEDPSCHIARFGTNLWVRGSTFLEFGDIAFDSCEFHVKLDSFDHARSEVLVTTETFPPYAVAARLGVVGAERVMGIDVLKELGIGVTDITGGTSEIFQSELSKARREVIADLKRQAAGMGAHGVIGLNLAYSPIGAKNTMMLMVAGWGTAVTFSSDSAG